MHLKRIHGVIPSFFNDRHCTNILSLIFGCIKVFTSLESIDPVCTPLVLCHYWFEIRIYYLVIYQSCSFTLAKSNICMPFHSYYPVESGKSFIFRVIIVKSINRPRQNSSTMHSKLNLITAFLLGMSANAQSNKYIVANSFAAAGCGGESSGTTHINTGQCYYLKEECGKNPALAPECKLFKAQTLGEDLSFKATCSAGKISIVVFNGKGCDNPATALANGTALQTPDNVCLSNFKLQCSDDPNGKSTTAAISDRSFPTSSKNNPIVSQIPSSADTDIPGILLGLVSLFIV